MFIKHYYNKLFLTFQYGDLCHKVSQFHFTEWPDLSTPLSTKGMVAMVRKMKEMKCDLSSPVIHCR